MLASCTAADRQPKWPATTVAELQEPRPPSVERLRARLQSRGPGVARCYRTEAVNSEALSSFEWRVVAPPNGAPLEGTVVVASRPEQVLLRKCIETALFTDQRFGPYDARVHGVVATNIVIRAPGREEVNPSGRYLRAGASGSVSVNTPDSSKTDTEADRTRKCEAYCSMFKVPLEQERVEPGRDYYGCLRDCRATKAPFSIPGL